MSQRVDEALKQIRSLIGCEDAHVPSAAVKALWAVEGDPQRMMPLLLDHLQGPSVFWIHDACDILGEIGPDAVAAVPRLRELLTARYEWTQVHAAAALWNIVGEPETQMAPSTVWEILKSAGVDPAGDRTRHPQGPGTRRHLHPTSDWVVQQACNLLMDLEDADSGARFLIHDRDASFGAAFGAVFTAAGVDVIGTGIRAPRQNSIMECWFRSLRAELTDRTLIWSVPHLLRLLREYEEHCNSHRPHRSLGQAAPSKTSGGSRTVARSSGSWPTRSSLSLSTGGGSRCAKPTPVRPVDPTERRRRASTPEPA